MVNIVRTLFNLDKKSEPEPEPEPEIKAHPKPPIIHEPIFDEEE
jgi:hypothetical protein